MPSSIRDSLEQLVIKHRTPVSKFNNQATTPRSSWYAWVLTTPSSVNQTQPPRNLSLIGAARMYIRHPESLDGLRCFMCKGWDSMQFSGAVFTLLLTMDTKEAWS